MDANGYLHWLRTTDLQATNSSNLSTAVDAVIDGLQQEIGEDSPEPSCPEDEAHREIIRRMLEALGIIQGGLNSGELPIAEIQAFRDEFVGDPTIYEPAEVLLERELREIAAGMDEARWSTELYQEFERSIEKFLEGGEEAAFWETIEEIEGIVTTASDSYRQTEILPKEVTMESTTVHNLLCEGIGLWQAALEALRDEETDEEPNWDWVQEAAESGNRLLVAVQIFNERLQHAIPLQSKPIPG